MPPIQDSGPSCHRSKEVRSIRYFISAESCPQPRETMPRSRRRPWPSSGQSWSCVLPPPRKFTLVTDHAPLQWMARQGHQRQGDSLVPRAPGLPLCCASPGRSRERQRRRSLSDLGSFLRSVRDHSPPTPNFPPTVSHLQQDQDNA